jgi:hypothetical protein
MDAPSGFTFEVRLWRPARATDAGGWATVGWCSTREYAELLAEAAMSEADCQFAEIWGASARHPDTRIALIRYDRGTADT